MIQLEYEDMTTEGSKLVQSLGTNSDQVPLSMLAQEPLIGKVFPTQFCKDEMLPSCLM